ncbi:MAG: NRDE family protein [Microscillaceae bacterium]|nr:NRDE family protein [Microscillaceae bacterium]
MCLIGFNWKNHATYKLILLANRDEFYQRKTAAAHFWEDYPGILAGRDLEAGGTWMGIHTQGRFTALTNYRDLKNLKAAAPSRGDLTVNFLKTDISPKLYLEQIAPQADAYNGFNLLVGTLDELYYFSNYENKIRGLKPGLYGLSNHLLDTPWYKVQKIKDKLSEELQKDSIDIEMLLKALYDLEKPKTAQIQQTGLPQEQEKMLSSVFIESPHYGTHASSIWLLDYDNRLTFIERRYHNQDHPGKVTEQQFELKFE